MDISPVVSACNLESRYVARHWNITVSPVLDFEQVYTRHVGYVWRILRGMGVSAALVEDAVQEVFLVVHRRLGEFDNRYSHKTWLYEIAFRVACDFRRKQKRANIHEPLSEGLSHKGLSPQQEAERYEQLRVLSEAMGRLDEKDRMILILAELEEMTAPEIVEVTQIRLNTVYTRLRRARGELSRILEKMQRRAP